MIYVPSKYIKKEKKKTKVKLKFGANLGFRTLFKPRVFFKKILNFKNIIIIPFMTKHGVLGAMFSLDREKKQTLHMLNTYHPCQ